MDTAPKTSLKDIILVDDLSQQGSPHVSVWKYFLPELQGRNCPPPKKCVRGEEGKEDSQEPES